MVEAQPSLVRPKLYLDTTVPSAYFDARTPERQQLTQQFWNERLPEYEVVISTLVLAEIADTPERPRRQELEDLVAGFAVLELSAEAESLADASMTQRVFTERRSLDGLHVAIASVHGVGYLVSWNFRHLVRVRTRRGVSLVNALHGYEPIEIIAPPEL